MGGLAPSPGPADARKVMHRYGTDDFGSVSAGVLTRLTNNGNMFEMSTPGMGASPFWDIANNRISGLKPFAPITAMIEFDITVGTGPTTDVELVIKRSTDGISWNETERVTRSAGRNNSTKTLQYEFERVPTDDDAAYGIEIYFEAEGAGLDDVKNPKVIIRQVGDVLVAE